MIWPGRFSPQDYLHFFISMVSPKKKYHKTKYKPLLHITPILLKVETTFQVTYTNNKTNNKLATLI